MIRQKGPSTIITTNPDAMDRKVIFDYLHHYAYWSKGIPHNILMKALGNSVPFSLLVDGDMVGFARLVTDQATFAYLADVFILESHQGMGLGKFMVETINSWIDDHNIRTSLLLTRDAQSLYSQFNWKHPDDVQRVMRYKDRNLNFYGTIDRS